MENVFIGFGSNVGDSGEICRQAVEALGRRPGITVRNVSSLYRTEPVGLTEQDWFVNGVAHCETDLEPEELLRGILDIEKRFGRVRRERWGPRTLDLDILIHGERLLDEPWLTIPHPLLHERRFVLVPLAEIAPGLIHPRLGIAISDLLDRLDGFVGQQVVRNGV